MDESTQDAVRGAAGSAPSASIKAQWWRWHKANLHVYALFKRFTFEAIQRGHTHYSSKAIFERIRWHTEIETTGEEFKMSNNYTPYYARLFMHEHPQYAEFFRTKTLRSTDVMLPGRYVPPALQNATSGSYAP